MKKLSALMLAAFMGCSAVSAQQGDTPSVGFHTDGLRILDAKNNEFVMRGVNYSYAWQRGHEETVIPRAKELGCNAIRIQLSTGRRRDLNIPASERPDVGQKCTRDDVEKLIRLCEENKLVCVLNTHDETGYDGEDWLASAVDYWLSMKDLLNAHRNTVIVNVSNEWFGSWNSWGWKDGYVNQIPRLREGGLKNMLIVDCAGWGQYPQSVLDGGDAVYESDPDRNLAFSVHFYDYAGASDQDVEYTMWNLTHQLRNSVPLIAGEFSYEHMGRHVSWQKVLSYSYDRKIGYFAWSWTDNGGGAEACDLFVAGDYEGKTFATNGKAMFLSRYGIEDTSRECSIFDDAVPANCPDYNVFREGAPHEDYPLNGITGEIGGSGSGGEGGGNTSSGSTDSLWEGTWTMLWEGGEDFQYQPGEDYYKNNEMQGLEIGDKLVFSYKDLGSNPEFQLVVKYGSAWTWTEVIPYAPIVDGKYTYEITDAEVPGYPSSSMVATMREHGFVIKGNDATLVRIELVKKNGGSTTDPTPGDDYDPSIEEPLPDDSSKLHEDVTIKDNIGLSYDSGWNNELHITADELGRVRRGDKIHVYLSNTNGNSQFQFAYKVSDPGDWIKYHDATGVDGQTKIDIPVENTSDHKSFIRGLNYDGFYIKGRDYTLDRVSVTRREDISLGIDNARVDGAEMFDFDAPFEIYTIDGRRVSEMLPGVMYILRQGSTVKKFIAR